MSDHIAEVSKKGDLISRQTLCNALDNLFAVRVKSAGFDSYETAERDTQLVCDGIMRAIDVVLDQPTVEHLAEVSKKGDLISRADAIDAVNNIMPTKEGFYEPCEVLEELMRLPSARPERKPYHEVWISALRTLPERKKGKWIDAYPDIEPNPMFMYGICSVCGCEQAISNKLNFCPDCGADMRGEEG